MRHTPPSQTWRTFLAHHVRDLVSLDVFTVPTARLRVLFVLVVLAHHRRRLVPFNVTEHPTAEWTAQQIVDALPERHGAVLPVVRQNPVRWPRRLIFPSDPARISVHDQPAAPPAPPLPVPLRRAPAARTRPRTPESPSRLLSGLADTFLIWASAALAPVPDRHC